MLPYGLISKSTLHCKGLGHEFYPLELRGEIRRYALCFGCSLGLSESERVSDNWPFLSNGFLGLKALRVWGLELQELLDQLTYPHKKQYRGQSRFPYRVCFQSGIKWGSWRLPIASKRNILLWIIILLFLLQGKKIYCIHKFRQTGRIACQYNFMDA